MEKNTGCCDLRPISVLQTHLVFNMCHSQIYIEAAQGGRQEGPDPETTHLPIGNSGPCPNIYIYLLCASTEDSVVDKKDKAPAPTIFIASVLQH